MALLPKDEQSAEGDEGMEAYAPAVRGAKSKKVPAAKQGTPSGAASQRSEGGLGRAFSGLRVSLMPSELEGKAPPDLGRRLLILALVLVIETIAVGAGYFFVSRAIDARVAKRDELDGQIAQLTRDFAKQEETAAKEEAAYNGQVIAAKEALDNHVFWTRFFTFLESKTRPTVRYLNFSGDSDSGVVTLDAVGRTYRDVAEQIVALKEEPMIADVRTAAASAKVDEKGEINGVAFTMVLKLKPEAWLQPKPAPKAP